MGRALKSAWSTVTALRTLAIIVISINSLQRCFTEKNTTSNDVFPTVFHLLRILTITYMDILMTLKQGLYSQGSLRFEKITHVLSASCLYRPENRL